MLGASTATGTPKRDQRKRQRLPLPGFHAMEGRYGPDRREWCCVRGSRNVAPRTSSRLCRNQTATALPSFPARRGVGRSKQCLGGMRVFGTKRIHGPCRSQPRMVCTYRSKTTNANTPIRCFPGCEQVFHSGANILRWRPSNQGSVASFLGSMAIFFARTEWPKTVAGVKDRGRQEGTDGVLGAPSLALSGNSCGGEEKQETYRLASSIREATHNATRFQCRFRNSETTITTLSVFP